MSYFIASWTAKLGAPYLITCPLRQSATIRTLREASAIQSRSVFYPDTANFIGFVANLSSRNLVRQSIALFRQHTAFPSEGVAAPSWIMGIGWSDHWSFWKEGYPAIMVTDTALFRYGPYHSAEDTSDKIDFDRVARAVAGLSRVVEGLADGLQ